MTITENKRETEAARRRSKTRDAQDIGEIPPVVDFDRRRKAEGSFSFFCETYFPQAFVLPWTKYHFDAAARIEQACTKGGLFAFAMPRGSGKTTICEWAILWSVLTSKVAYALLVGATESDAEKRLANGVRVELQSNDLLLEDWPEVCYPVQALEREVRRCAGQKHFGEPTAITWTNKQLILPSIKLRPGEAYNTGKKIIQSGSSGAIVGVGGITSSIRGLKHKREDGTNVRPELAIIDDPQTRDSAKSVTQSATRAATIAGDVNYLGGPGGKPIAVVMPCTVIYQGDMVDQMLDRQLHPRWQGVRTKLVNKFPDGFLDGDMDSETNRKWAEYCEIQENEYRNDGDGSQATAFYAENREIMDAGFEVTWAERHDDDELSAIQHAMNCYYRDPAAFFSEYQNEPVSKAEVEPELTDEQIANKMTAHGRGVIPARSEVVTAFVDVGKSLLHWTVVAWENGFTGQVIDYGVYPDQGTMNFDSATASRTIAKAHPGTGFEAALYAALSKLITDIGGKQYRREDGVHMPIKRLMIDANWSQSTDIVYRLCSSHALRSILTPAHGVFVGATTKPWSETKGKIGEQMGHHWRLQAAQGLRKCITDVNYWKSFVYDRFNTSMGAAGCLSLFNLPQSHTLLAQHINAEYRVPVEAKGRVVEQWEQRPDRPDNHWFDCLVGSAAAASIEGIQLKHIHNNGGGSSVRKYTGKSKLSELQAKKRRRK